MIKKKKTADTRQLTLFDSGLDAPPSAVPRRRRPSVPPAEPEIIPPEPRPATIRAAPFRRGEVESDGREPAPFEKASYDLYLLRKAEARNYTQTAAVLLVILLFVAVLRIQPLEAAFSIIKFVGVPIAYFVGVLGWATLLYTCFALQSAAQAALKKRQCGLFYQRVLRFSDSPLTKWIEPLLTTLYTCCMLGAIALTFIVAGSEMLELIKHILVGVLNIFRIGPWQTTGS
jgi:hypothetical protein